MDNMLTSAVFAKSLVHVEYELAQCLPWFIFFNVR
jgi:hypothetical protein